MHLAGAYGNQVLFTVCIQIRDENVVGIITHIIGRTLLEGAVAPAQEDRRSMAKSQPVGRNEIELSVAVKVSDCNTARMFVRGVATDNLKRAVAIAQKDSQRVFESDRGC